MIDNLRFDEIPLSSTESINERIHSLSKIHKEDNIGKKSYIPISLLFGFYYIIYTMAIPALPALMLDLTNDSSSQSSFLYGLANFVRYFLEFFAAPVLGSITDNKGRKGMLILSFLACAVEFGILAVVPSIPVVFISRALSGSLDSATPTSFTIMTDLALYNQDSVTEKYGVLGAVQGLGYIVGPLLGGFLCSIDIRLCFLVTAAISLIGAILTYFLLEETMSLNGKKEYSSHYFEWKKVNPFPALKLHFSNRSLRVLTYPLALSSLNLGLGFIWYIYMDYRFHSSATEIGIYLAFYGVVSAFIQGLLIKWLMPKIWNDQQASVYGFLLLTCQYIAYGLTPNGWGLYAAVFLFTIGTISDPALKSLIVQESLRQSEGLQLQGNLQGVLCSIRTLATAFGSLIFSNLFSYSISTHPTMPYLSMIVGAFLYGLSGLYLMALFRESNGYYNNTEYILVNQPKDSALLDENNYYDEHLNPIVEPSDDFR